MTTILDDIHLAYGILFALFVGPLATGATIFYLTRNRSRHSKTIWRNRL